jgi:hypothetical protein
MTHLVRNGFEPSMTDRIIEAAYLMLDMESDPKDWSSADYTAALRKRFPPLKPLKL